MEPVHNCVKEKSACDWRGHRFECVGCFFFCKKKKKHAWEVWPRSSTALKIRETSAVTCLWPSHFVHLSMFWEIWDVTSVKQQHGRSERKNPGGFSFWESCTRLFDSILIYHLAKHHTAYGIKMSVQCADLFHNQIFNYVLAIAILTVLGWKIAGSLVWTSWCSVYTD